MHAYATLVINHHLSVGSDVISRIVLSIVPKAYLCLSIILLFTLILSACQTQPEPSAMGSAVTTELNKAKPLPELSERALLDLLDQAEAAVKRDHLTYPQQGSALEIYQEILRSLPTQEDALRGMENIVERYIALAMQALDRRRFASARSMLARARLIDPKHPSIGPTAQQINLLSAADRETLVITQAQLNNPDQKLSDALSALGQTPAQHRCRFNIAAKNDAQGRWIYQQLNPIKNGAKPRNPAQIVIRLPTTVERLCFPNPT